MTTNEGENRVFTGQVSQWHEDEGWGVVDSSELGSPAWAHFSNIDASGHGFQAGAFRALHVGDQVKFTVERAEQDGFHWRTTWISLG